MRITKYAHACLVVEEQGKKLVLDPGGLTPDFGELAGIVAVVVTHQHYDHFNAEHLQAIIAANPDVRIFMPEDAQAQFNDRHVQAVRPSQQAAVGPFTLRFFGGQHAVVHSSLAMPENVGVLVNDTLYYPGDSLAPPQQPPKILALPTSAPWLKIGESIDYLLAVKPVQCFSTHDAILSDAGHQLVQKTMSNICQQHGIAYKHLMAGQSLDV